MIKIFILFLFLILMTAPITLADEGYVSPESYAVNEADMTDYMDIPSQARPDIDNLDQKQKTVRSASERKVKEPKEPKAPKKPYEKTLIYKSAKWLKDQGYKYEDPHHGQKHEIKIKTREEYEKQQAEEAAKKEQNQQY